MGHATLIVMHSDTYIAFQENNIALSEHVTTQKHKQEKTKPYTPIKPRTALYTTKPTENTEQQSQN